MRLDTYDITQSRTFDTSSWMGYRLLNMPGCAIEESLDGKNWNTAEDAWFPLRYLRVTPKLDVMKGEYQQGGMLIAKVGE